MTVTVYNPIQTVSEENRDIAYFDNLFFQVTATFAGATLMAGQLAGLYPFGVAADQFELNMPQFSRSKYVRLEMIPQLVLRAEAPTVAMKNDLLNFGNSVGQSIQCDGVPYYLNLTPDKPFIVLAKQSLQTVTFSEMRVRYNVDPVNTTTTPFFTFSAAAVHQAWLFIKPTVYFER